GAREADDDRAVEQAIVVGVQRLALLEHHVVGDVDDGGGRADGAALGALTAPCRRGRLRIDAFDHARGEPRASDLLLDPYFARGAARNRRRGEGGQRERRRGRGREIAWEPDHRQATGAVRGGLGLG